MKQFQFIRAIDTKSATRSASEHNGHFFAGGTNLLDLMKMEVTKPDWLIDINRIPLKNIEEIGTGIRIGALATNTYVAENNLIKVHFPLLSAAIHAGASPQLRNMATTGGNIMQRTRCPYFWDVNTPCNKRSPGTGCGALDGFNRMHAILGASDHCIAVNPSDMNVALLALDALLHLSGPEGIRSVKLKDFHRLPGQNPEKDTIIKPAEMITHIDVPFSPFNLNFSYLKVRDRASYAFALVSAAIGLQIESGLIKDARVAMGGVAHKPWRFYAIENFLIGKAAKEQVFQEAIKFGFHDARAYQHNQYKLELAPNAILSALNSALVVTP